MASSCLVTLMDGRKHSSPLLGCSYDRPLAACTLNNTLINIFDTIASLCICRIHLSAKLIVYFYCNYCIVMNNFVQKIYQQIYVTHCVLYKDIHRYFYYFIC